MQWRTTVIVTLLLSLLSCSGWPHADPAELGHHWEMHSYRAEMWLQISLMILVVGIYLLATLLTKRLRRWFNPAGRQGRS